MTGSGMAGGRTGVLFDVDGTLVDTNYLHTVAWRRALVSTGHWAPMHAIHRLIGTGGERLLTELLGEDDPETRQVRKEEYRGLFDEIRAFPSAGDLLRAAHNRGLVVVLASSSPADELEVARRVIDADDVIDAQTTADDVEHAKPAPEVFLGALEAGRLEARRSVAVGDSVWDVHAARAAGIACVGLESGGFSRSELADAGALHVYRDVAELLALFLTSPLALVGHD